MKALQYIQVLALLAGIVYLAVFHFDNPTAVSFPVPFVTTVVAPPSVALLGGFVAGLLYASLLYVPPLVRGVARARRTARRARELEAENARLRAPVEVPVIPDRADTVQAGQ